MTDQEIIKTFQDVGALLDGHFVLRSKLHSDKFFQAALLFKYPDIAEKLCRTLAERMKGLGAETVISPQSAVFSSGRNLRAHSKSRRFLQTRKMMNWFSSGDSRSARARRSSLRKTSSQKAGRVQQTIDLVRSFGGDPVAVGIITDRSGGTVDFGIPLFSLIKLNLPTYQPEECPLCKQGIPVVRPGSKS